MNTTDRAPLSPATLERMRNEAITQVMARWGDPTALGDVKQWLHGTLRDGTAPSESISGTAFETLFEVAAKADPATARALVEEGLGHRHLSVRERAIDAALVLRDEAFHPKIARLLVDRSDVVQRAARNALIAVDLHNAGAEILATIGHPKPTSAEAPAPVTLTKLGHAAVITSILDNQARDQQTKDLDYRIRARIYALETVMRPNTIGGLGEALLAIVDDCVALSAEQLSALPALACAALQYISDRHDIAKALITRLEKPVDGASTWLLNALGWTHVQEAIPTLQHYVEHGDLYQQRAAIVGLGRLHGTTARGPVEKLWHEICSKTPA